MTPTPEDFVKQAIAVHFPASSGGVVETRVAKAIKANVNAGEFARGYPAAYSLNHAEAPSDGAFVLALVNYFRASPLSANDLSEAMGAVGDGRHEGVALSFSDEGIYSVEFTGR